MATTPPTSPQRAPQPPKTIIMSAPAVALTCYFDIVPVPDEDMSEYIRNSTIEIAHSEAKDLSITCFDVSNSGLIAIGFHSHSGIVHIYNNDGSFLRRYQFKVNGKFSVGFIGDDLAVYFLRGNLIKVFNSEGQLAHVYTLPSTPRNINNTHKLLQRTTKEINGKTYTLESDIPNWTSFSRLVRTNEDGSRDILYDATFAHNFKTICSLFFIIFFFALCIRGVIQQSIYKAQQEN